MDSYKASGKRLLDDSDWNKPGPSRARDVFLDENSDDDSFPQAYSQANIADEYENYGDDESFPRAYSQVNIADEYENYGDDESFPAAYSQRYSTPQERDTQSHIYDSITDIQFPDDRRYGTPGEFNIQSHINNSPSDNKIEDAVILEEKLRRENKKYQGEEVTYHARIDVAKLPPYLRVCPLVAAAQCLRKLFSMLLERCTRRLKPSDLIRICLRSDGLDKPISTCLISVATMTVEKIMATVMKVLQSKDEIKLDSGFMVDVITITRDIGAGRQRVINIEVDRLRKKSVFSIPYDSEGLCCAKAIVFAEAFVKDDKKTVNSLRNTRRPALLNAAKALHEAANVPLGPCTYDEIRIFEEFLDLQIVVISAQNMNKVSYKDSERVPPRKRINLWLHDGHFDVIKKLNQFYGSHFYCEACEKPYQTEGEHHCPFTCPICQETDCIKGVPIRCNDCDRLCRSMKCFDSHKSKSGNQTLSLCDKIYQCRECCKVILRRNCPKEMHRCGTTKCASCDKYVIANEHQCYLRREESKPVSDKLIFFDFETDQETGEHVVNFALAQYSDGSEVIFKGYTACQDFCSWLFSGKHKGYTAIAHNMKGFDGQFILGWLLNQGLTPEVIPCGSKLMSICLKTLSIRIIDSYNFLPMSLSKMPSCFGFTELKKGYFPHLFNCRQNQAYDGIIPDVKYYSPETMSNDARLSFLAWHKEHEKDTFVFQEEILTYCRSDVDILRRCCLEFRHQFLELADIDPFRYVTIASVSMAMFRAKHMRENTIAMVPVHGYINTTNFSGDSIRWLDFMAEKNNIIIYHALNGLGEKKIDGISVDGFCDELKIIYQYHGCFFHGCPSCFDADIKNPLHDVSMGTLFQNTKKTSEKLRALGYTVVEIWEHEFAKQKKEDLELQRFLESHELAERLKPRDAFFGERTNAVRLFYEGPAKYVDFTSLYPWVNKYCKYPIGHPKIITESFEDLSKYFGLIKCKVLPPRGLFLPVLPYRCKEKLMFPLCRTCAETMSQSKCYHKDDKRCLIGTWVTEEVKLAIEKDYRIIKIYEVYHFDESSTSLFRDYINKLLQIKQESSGWPASCETLEQKDKYIKQYFEHEGIKLNELLISKNPGKRQVAKLGLNSLWGRFGMNLNKPQLTYVNSVSAFNKLFLDSTKNVKDVYFPTTEIAALVWESTVNFTPQDATTNIFIAAFTTAWARIKLYTEMYKLGNAVLYHDTDSIIYATNGLNDPPLGNFLGEFTDELEGDVISIFVSGGPKNYAYKTETGKTSCKIRGFTLNFSNSAKLNFDTLKSLITNMDMITKIPIYNPTKITRDAKRRKIINKAETKLYGLVYDKRVIQDDLTTLPYGY